MNCVKYLEALPYLHLHADPLAFGYTLARPLPFAGRLSAASINKLKEKQKEKQKESKIYYRDSPRIASLIPRVNIKIIRHPTG